MLLERGASANVRDQRGNTPKYEAVINGHAAVAAALHQRAGHLGLTSEQGASELNKAVRSGNMEMLQRLVANGVEPNACDYENRNCLHLAASVGNVVMIEFLLSRDVDPNLKDRWGGTPLADAVREGHMNVVEALLGTEWDDTNLQEKADPNLTDKDGRTVLHTAAMSGNMSLVELLIEAGADKDATDNWGITPRDCAEKIGHQGLVQILG